MGEQRTAETRTPRTSALLVVHTHCEQVESCRFLLPLVAGKISKHTFGEDLSRDKVKDVFRVGVVQRVMRKLINRGKGGCPHLCQDSACFPHQDMVIPSNQVANRLCGQIAALHKRLMGSQPLGRILQGSQDCLEHFLLPLPAYEPGSQANRYNLP